LARRGLGNWPERFPPALWGRTHDRRYMSAVYFSRHYDGGCLRALIAGQTRIGLLPRPHPMAWLVSLSNFPALMHINGWGPPSQFSPTFACGLRMVSWPGKHDISPADGPIASQLGPSSLWEVRASSVSSWSALLNVPHRLLRKILLQRKPPS